MDAISHSGSYYEESSSAVIWLVAVFLMMPVVARTWKRPLPQVAAYGLGFASFSCLWTAAGSGAHHPFTKEQWFLLGVTLLAASGVAWRVQRQGTM